MRYPGALLSDTAGLACSAVGPNGAAGPTGFTVGIPFINSDTFGGGGETVTWVPVLQEIRSSQDQDCPARGPFSLLYVPAQDDCGSLDADPLPDRGLAAVRVNYPYQAGMLTGFRSSFGDPLAPNLSNPIVANEGSVLETNTPPGAQLADDGTLGAYAGPFGLGRQFALGQTVRPFRRLVSAQAIYRREVFE